jgi:AraC-like DNA-binding protein
VTVADLRGGIPAGQHLHGQSFPVQMNLFAVMLVSRGSIRISLNYIAYTVTANHLLMVMPDIVVRIEESSGDLAAKVLMVDRTYLDGEVAKSSLPMEEYMRLRKNPCIAFTPEETAHTAHCFVLLGEKLKLRAHTFYREVIQNSVIAFYLELANILVEKKDSFSLPPFSHKEEIVNRFLQLLLEHAGTHHPVAFYAGKLCLTPQYLAQVLKEVTGKSPNKWMDEALIAEAKVLLKTPKITIQNVSDTLKFSDQSAFGKFFKKFTGMSPKEYRKL